MLHVKLRRPAFLNGVQSKYMGPTSGRSCTHWTLQSTSARTYGGLKHKPNVNHTSHLKPGSNVSRRHPSAQTAMVRPRWVGCTPGSPLLLSPAPQECSKFLSIYFCGFACSSILRAKSCTSPWTGRGSAPRGHRTIAKPQPTRRTRSRRASKRFPRARRKFAPEGEEKRAPIRLSGAPEINHANEA